MATQLFSTTDYSLFEHSDNRPYDETRTEKLADAICAKGLGELYPIVAKEEV